MKVTRGGDHPPEPMDAGHFNGDVHAQDFGAYSSPDASVLLVRFPAGAHSNWHSHPGGQFLYVTEGRGRVGLRDGTVAEIGAGDLVHAPPGEEHWHGASADQGVAHLAVSIGATEWLEPVTSSAGASLPDPD